MEDKRSGEVEPITAEGVLKQAIYETNKLEDEAKRALYLEKNPKKHIEKLIKRAQIVLYLPNKVKNAPDGGSFPKEELENLNSLSYMASEAIEVGKSFSLGTLLYEQGSKVGDPNMLKVIVNRIYAPKQAL